jgi:hypothetical protein
MRSMASGQQPTNPSGAGPLAINGTDFGHPTKPNRRVSRRPTAESSEKGQAKGPLGRDSAMAVSVGRG